VAGVCGVSGATNGVVCGVGQMGDAGGGTRAAKKPLAVVAAVDDEALAGDTGVIRPWPLVMLNTTEPRGAWLLIRCVTFLEKKRPTVPPSAVRSSLSGCGPGSSKSK